MIRNGRKGILLLEKILNCKERRKRNQRRNRMDYYIANTDKGWYDFLRLIKGTDTFILDKTMKC